MPETTIDTDLVLIGCVGTVASGRWSFFPLPVPLVAVQLDLTLTFQVAGVAAV